jgi:hypothetical protein
MTTNSPNVGKRCASIITPAGLERPDDGMTSIAIIIVPWRAI